MQQLCLVHGLQLAVIKVLYSTNGRSDANIDMKPDSPTADIDSSDSDEEYLSENFYAEQQTDQLYTDFKHVVLGPLINKVRDVVKMFKRSPTKNDNVLQPYIKQEFNKEISLKMDCKTRWSSMCDMLETFYKVRLCVKKALIDLKVAIEFSEFEFNLMENTIAALLPVKITVEALCREDATLISADAALQFMFERLAEVEGEISEKLSFELNERVNQRRTEAASVVQFLHGQTDVNGFKFKIATKHIAGIFVSRLMQRLNAHESSNLNDDTSVSQVDIESSEDSEEENQLIQNENMSLKAMMDKAISSAIAPKSNPLRFSNDMDGCLKREIATFVANGVRGELLEKCYKYLLAIPPTSVESERAFSASTLICTKIRSRLNDDTIDALCFLKAHFKNVQKQNKQ